MKFVFFFIAVVILSVRGLLVRKFMLAAHALGMTKGDWIFLDVEIFQVNNNNNWNQNWFECLYSFNSQHSYNLYSLLIIISTLRTNHFWSLNSFFIYSHEVVIVTLLHCVVNIGVESTSKIISFFHKSVSFAAFFSCNIFSFHVVVILLLIHSTRFPLVHIYFHYYYCIICPCIEQHSPPLYTRVVETNIVYHNLVKKKKYYI